MEDGGKDTLVVGPWMDIGREGGRNRGYNNNNPFFYIALNTPIQRCV